MKRIVVSALGVLLIAVFVGVMGCESGGVDTGIPKDTTPGVPIDKMKEMADMSKGPKAPNTPAGGAAPSGPMATPSAPAEAPKK